ncbi:NAD(P)/FAD-dependent oxidoreductase [Abyssalbus ytuae]|uniref:FAD-binding oxidoreductase n=1 Tax=Abyssalbus ytuae TaxID=2926907 RepID=A0A9E7A0Q6_9FLAO|nr:FAD-dependent oxidoreductase [Abyssalbus ytuae]UOB17586.1 FAD-binding oxidoreductase [Abyssalbus ytuae]
MDLKSSEPFWLVKNGLINSYPSLKNDIDADVLIIGSGITGSLIAHQCVKDGYSTVVLDKREVANGSTSATTSMLQYEIDVPLYKLIELIGKEGAVKSYKACFDSIGQLKKIVKEIKSDCGFEEKQSLYYAARKKDVNWLKKEFKAREENDFPVKWLEAQEIEEKFKFLHTYGGILSNKGGSIDAFKLAHDLLSYNVKKGLKIFDKTKTDNIQYKSDSVIITTDSGNKIKCKKIIFCNGFESTEILKEDFVKLLSTYAIVSEVFEKDISFLDKILLWNTADPYIYLRTTCDNRILIGGEDEDFINEEKRERLLSKKAEKLKKYITKILPDYEFRTDFAWAGRLEKPKMVYRT